MAGEFLAAKLLLKHNAKATWLGSAPLLTTGNTEEALVMPAAHIVAATKEKTLEKSRVYFL